MPAPIPSTPPAVVVLAAGAGRRFGARPKLAEPFGERSVLGTTLAQVERSGLPMIVVAGDETLDEALRWAARDDVLHLRAGATGGARRGMGWSIAAGVAARPRAGGWIVLPGDMPLVRPGSLRAVAQALAAHDIACAHHRGRRGHPVGFAVELYSELVRLDGDEGARRLLARYPSHAVDLDDAGVLDDVDTPADLERLRLVLSRDGPPEPTTPAEATSGCA